MVTQENNNQKIPSIWNVIRNMALKKAFVYVLLKVQLSKGQYTYDVHENCLIFMTPHPPLCPSTSKTFPPLDIGRPDLNEPPPPSSPTLSNKLWNNNRTVYLNERNQNKNKTKSRYIQIDHAFHCSI